MKRTHGMLVALMPAALSLIIVEAFVQPNPWFPSTGPHRNSQKSGTSMMAGRSSAVVALQAAEAEEGSHESLGLSKQTTPPALSVPVFSLATMNEDGSTNMNIVTYATPVGIEPERLWMVSLYKSTLSYENFVREGWGVLQLLRRKHTPLVPILGQNGGREIDKSGRCTGEAFSWVQPSCELLSVPRSIGIVRDCASYIVLHMIRKQSAGDHDAFICRVGSVVGPEDDQQNAENAQLGILESGHLREDGII